MTAVLNFQAAIMTMANHAGENDSYIVLDGGGPNDALLALEGKAPNKQRETAIDVGNDIMLVPSKELCPRCHTQAVHDSGEPVIEFGDLSFWHVECFRCAICGDPVPADGELLRSPGGGPICPQCSCKCDVCYMPIQQDAVVSGDESYHPECFICKACETPIRNMVFAKTNRGIYCMACHRAGLTQVTQRTRRDKRGWANRHTNKIDLLV